jgi:hypothetical protein
MTAELTRQFVRQQPFRPFTIRMNDRRKFAIKHPDFVAPFPNGSQNVIVFLFLGGERFEIIYSRNVTGIESEGPVPQPAKRRRGRGDEPSED